MAYQIKSIEFAYQYASVINQEEFFQIKKLTKPRLQFFWKLPVY